jgi:organic hydroperoxide reductase OsmC/OhrA
MHVFKTTMEWRGGERLVSRCDGRPDLDLSSPPAFGGEAGRWTPEDLLCSAVESCVVLTTLFFVRRQNIGLISWKSRACATLEKGPAGLRFQTMDVEVDAVVSAAEDEPRLRDAVRQAEQYCPVSNALKIPVTVRASVAVRS